MDEHIERLQRQAAQTPGLLSLAAGLPAEELFPRAALGRAFLQALREPAASALQYGWAEGREPLRAWVAARLRARGADVSADDVIITSGAQQALAIAAHLLLRRGGIVAAGAETYPSALDLFRTAGGQPRAASPEARFAYAMPAIANPRGRSATAEERRALLALRVPIVEDDAYAELRFDGRVPRPLLAQARGRVWHVGTFSKTLAPGLRVGWLVPPPRQRARALREKSALDLQANSLSQSILERFLAQSDYDARLERARRFYAGRADALMRALRRHLPSWRFDEPDGGFSLWIEPDGAGDEGQLLALAVEEGVSFDPGQLFRPEPGPLGLRLCYSATRPRQMEEAARRLARAWARFQRGEQATAA